MDGFGGFAQGLTNAMHAIAYQVIRASGKSVRNGRLAKLRWDI
jgi:hypothetical protein